MEWIPITERLPSKNEDVLLFMKREYAGSSWNEQFVGFLTEKRNWQGSISEGCYFAFESVKYWMPLPEKPKDV